VAEVRVLLDPGDDMQVSVGMLERHDPARGHVVVHPTPGARSLQGLRPRRAGRAGPGGEPAGRRAARRACGRLAGRDRMDGDQPDRGTGGAARRPAPGGRLGPAVELGRETGTRLLLVCRAPQILARLAAVLADTGHQVLTGLPQVLDSRSAYPHPRPWPDATAGAEADADDLPRFLYPHIRNYRTKAFDQLGPAGFARTDAVYRHAREAACHCLSTRPAPGPAAASDQSVQLLLAWLVHDSPSRTHTLARLRGAQAGFRLHGFKLDIPPSQWVLDVLNGPELDAPLVTTQTAGRIRAGVAHPVIAAGIATVLVTGVEPLALASMPWEALSPQNDALRLTWHSPQPHIDPGLPGDHPYPRHHRRVLRVGCRTAAAADRTPLQPLLPWPPPAGRLFATTPFSNEQIAGAAANCKILLLSRRSLQGMWQTRVTCTRVDSFGTRFDASQRLDRHAAVAQLADGGQHVRGRAAPPVRFPEHQGVAGPQGGQGPGELWPRRAVLAGLLLGKQLVIAVRVQGIELQLRVLVPG
jgi:hypothetical protein